jgi:hypothetical protein
MIAVSKPSQGAPLRGNGMLPGPGGITATTTPCGISSSVIIGVARNRLSSSPGPPQVATHRTYL